MNNTMLPFNQLASRDKLESSIKNSCIVNDLKGNKVRINRTLNKVMVERKTSYKYFSNIHSNKCYNTIFLNIGNSTIDSITMDNVQNERQEMITGGGVILLYEAIREVLGDRYKLNTCK